MSKFIRALFLVLFVPFMASTMVSISYAESTTPGKIVGGKKFHSPDWFKNSFLDLKEDASEAAAAGKHAMLFFDLEGCPYCARMISESVEPQRALIEPYFDSISLDVKGSRQVSIDGKNELEERELANKFGVRFTPTVIFLDKDAKPVFRINGFWNAAQFRVALSYVKTKSYKTMKIGAYARSLKSKPVYEMKKHALLSDVTDFSKIKTPLLVLFEDDTCSACPELHSSILNRPDVLKELKAYTFVRLDARKDVAMIDPDGNKTTTAKWAQKLGVRLSPTFIAFDEGNEIQRVDSTLYSHHFSAILAYASGKHYKKYDNWLAYLGTRTRAILKSGKNVDLSRDGVGVTQ